MATKFHYSPLPPLVTVGYSEIDGQGILAKGFIPASTDVGICHIDVANLAMVTRANFGRADLNALYSGMADRYEPFPKGMFHNDLIRTPLGGFLNHSPNPNCIIIQDKLFWNLWTTEDIPIGDELCVDYNLYRCGFKVEGTDICKEPTEE